jgi:hypothetical protein
MMMTRHRDRISQHILIEGTTLPSCNNVIRSARSAQGLGSKDQLSNEHVQGLHGWFCFELQTPESRPTHHARHLNKNWRKKSAQKLVRSTTRRRIESTALHCRPGTGQSKLCSRVHSSICQLVAHISCFSTLHMYLEFIRMSSRLQSPAREDIHRRTGRAREKYLLRCTSKPHLPT